MFQYIALGDYILIVHILKNFSFCESYWFLFTLLNILLSLAHCNFSGVYQNQLLQKYTLFSIESFSYVLIIILVVTLDIIVLTTIFLVIV